MRRHSARRGGTRRRLGERPSQRQPAAAHALDPQLEEPLAKCLAAANPAAEHAEIPNRQRQPDQARSKPKPDHEVECHRADKESDEADSDGVDHEGADAPPETRPRGLIVRCHLKCPPPAR
jgi:hypothetical protein